MGRLLSADYPFKMMLDELPQPDVTLDCTGLYCPQPVIRTAAQVREMETEQILEVLATDPGFQIDLPAWCLSQRHEYLGMRQDGAVYVGYLRVLNYDSRISESQTSESRSSTARM